MKLSLMQATIEFGLSEIATTLAQAGRSANEELAKEFEADWDQATDMRSFENEPENSEHQLINQVISETLTWLQSQIEVSPVKPGKGPKILSQKLKLLWAYYDILDGGKKADIAGQLKAKLKKQPRRQLGVLAGLEAWTRAGMLPPAGSNGHVDLAVLQQFVLNTSKRPRWTTCAPIKLYALIQGGEVCTPPEIIPPMGTAVTRAIEDIFGIKLRETKGDYDISRRLHLRLAQQAGASIWDVNSGLYYYGHQLKLANI